MKVGIREYSVHAEKGGSFTQPAVILSVKVVAATIASEQLTPEQARVFARQLLEAADAADGGAL